MLPLDKTQHYYESYQWDGKHYIFGYPPDVYPEFKWIRSLEARYKYVKDNPSLLDSEAPLHLIREMIKWGGSKKRDISPKFDDYLGSYCLSSKLKIVIESLGNTKDAITAALDIPGLGPTYATKLLRFLKPDEYGALDDQIKKALLEDIKLRVKKDKGRASNAVDQYVAYIGLLKDHKNKLRQQLNKSMKIAEIEMALFQWAVESNKNSNKANSADARKRRG